MAMPTDVLDSEGCVAPERGRRMALPVLLFLATCASTFWTGAMNWNPLAHLDAMQRAITVFEQNRHQGSPVSAFEQALAVAQVKWQQGLIYMGVVMALLLAHEMGHFLTAWRYRIPSSLPYFIPLPIAPFGTLGAVIGMEGSRANRREMFDLGLAGPLAGLAVTVTVASIGILLLPTAPAAEGFRFHNPLLLQYMIAWLRPGYPTPAVLSLSHFNPFLMAGWVGMLITGLNMLPMSQLDGGHVAYAVLGRRRAHLLARGLLVLGIAYVIATGQYGWIIMLLLVILVGVDHPPTADDDYELGWPRRVLGWAALLIPVLCFNPWVIALAGR
jgi:membrane-associated protease RseP (regulator of RpoE activity)